MSTYSMIMREKRKARRRARALRELGAAIAELVAYAVMAFAVGFALIASLA